MVHHALCQVIEPAFERSFIADSFANRIGKVEMIYTVAFVAFGLFRYLQSIYVYHLGGEPETIILKDKMQLGNLALWLLVTLWIMF